MPFSAVSPKFPDQIAPFNQEDAVSISRDMGSKNNGAATASTVPGQHISADAQYPSADLGDYRPLGDTGAGGNDRGAGGTGRADLPGAGDCGPQTQTTAPEALDPDDEAADETDERPLDEIAAMFGDWCNDNRGFGDVA
jgi:hypothetical protein